MHVLGFNFVSHNGANFSELFQQGSFQANRGPRLARCGGLRMRRVLIIFGFVVLAAGLLWFGSGFWALRHDEMTASSHNLKATPEAVFAEITDLRAWSKWVYNQELVDKQTFSGAATGKGAVYEWGGSGEDNNGRAEITESSAPSKVVVDIDFKTLIDGRVTINFVIERVDSGSRVHATISGPTPGVIRAYGAFTGFAFWSLDCAARGNPEGGNCKIFNRMTGRKRRRSDARPN